MKPLVHHDVARQVWEIVWPGAGGFAPPVCTGAGFAGMTVRRATYRRRIQAYVVVRDFHLLHFAHSHFGV
ncbi:MAG: hypothetical protein O3A47_03170 [Chloroflexi bacterium]|nr:hypothetical protein [Chloroflexota bacterium]